MARQFVGPSGVSIDEQGSRQWVTASGWLIGETISAPAAGYVKVWSGSAWVEKPLKVWSGSAWVQKPVKVWNGSAWVLS